MPVNTRAVYFDADALPSFLREGGRDGSGCQCVLSSIVDQVIEQMTMTARAPTMYTATFMGAFCAVHRPTRKASIPVLPTYPVSSHPGSGG